MTHKQDSIHLLLLCLVLSIAPLTSSSGFSLQSLQFLYHEDYPSHYLHNLSTPVANKSYAVVFDAGSTGSRVHVFCFDLDLNLVPIGDDLVLVMKTYRDLSDYANDPKLAAASLKPLLSEAERVIPPQLRPSTPVRVGVTVNYLLGNLGERFPKTVGIVELGGGSVQMAYTISAKHAAEAPKTVDPKDSYVKEFSLKEAKYYLYVHSYLNYGLLAARADILKVAKSNGSSCILNGFHGSYEYGGMEYKASASSAGSNINSCRRDCIKALKINSTCIHPKCTFGGIWNGGGGPGKRNLYVASYFFDRAANAGFIDPSQPASKVRPIDFGIAAKRACTTKLDEAKSR